MAALLPRTTTASTCIPDTAQGTHMFTISGYRLHKGMGVGNFIRSATFTVGGYDSTSTSHYLSDLTSSLKNTKGMFNAATTGASTTTPTETDLPTRTTFQSERSVVRALYDLRLTNQATGLSSLVFSRPSSFPAFNSCDLKGAGRFMKRDLLEESPYLRDDCIVIQCDVTVIKETRVVPSFRSTSEIQVPPSDLSDNLAKLLEGKKGTDLNIKVSGEAFYAHKIVLATRLPVFDAQLFGPMAMGDDKATTQCIIEIEDMQPAVFRALLHFMYTDSLPAMDGDDLDDSTELARHLLVAADRYAMERMKLICESILCKALDARTLVATLALSDQHHCSKLKDACIQYIKHFA